MTQPVEPEDHPLRPEGEDSDLRYDDRTEPDEGEETQEAG
jgi:hypothetical protein